jgi:tail collar domain/collagen triple helix repeat protein
MNCLKYAALCALVLGSTAVMAAPRPSVIIACYNKETGHARIVNSIADCHRDENFAVWNIQGPAGPTGPQGVAGPVGPQGLSGPAGAQGPAGPKGSNGATGPAGPAGAMGPAGPMGVAGATGPAGAIGPAGPAGAVGPVGAAGPVGPAGPAGPMGTPGAAGPAGAAGAVGPAGPSGPTGPAGPEGPTGPAGPAGTTGIFGSNSLDFFAGSGGAECTIGTITLNVAVQYPANYLPADGRILSIEENVALFSLIGINYGGDGETTFALPNLKSAAPDNTIYLICVTGIFP